MFEAGIFVALGLIVTFCKVSWRWRLRILSNPVLCDISVFTLLVVIHWGTFTGVMAATIGAFICSLLLAAGRWMFGYIEAGKIVPGIFSVPAEKL